MLSGRSAWWLSVLLVCAACEEPSLPPRAIWVDPATVPPKIDCTTMPNLTVCEGDWSGTCGASGNAKDWVNCSLLGESCVPNLGCRVCAPNLTGCDGDNRLFRCNEAGDEYEVIQTCEVGTVCNASASGCVNLCAAAEDTRSYVGCEYWAVTTSNSLLDGRDLEGVLHPRVFSFEIVVSNPQSSSAHVVIERDGHSDMAVDVAALTVERVVLPWVDDLVGRDDPRTVHARGAAYHVRSSVPVTIYQFNPMEFVSGGTPSFTNDASLLLPTHVLTGRYTVVSRPTLVTSIADATGVEVGRVDLPGFLAIVGVEDTEVEVTASAHTLASGDGSVPALVPGQSTLLSIRRGEVIQIVSAAPETCIPDARVDEMNDGLLRRYCIVGNDYDLTGTVIRATGKVSVFSGHDCARVPFNVVACDHLEEQLFPEEVWGRQVPVAISASIPGVRELPDIVRVLSASDDNRVSFTPGVHADVTLDAGEHMELVADEDFVVSGTGALLVSQFLVGFAYDNVEQSTGDPAMSLAIPDEQWRTSYAFMVPDTYEEDFVNVIAPTGAPISLDERVIARDEWRPIEGTPLSTARIAVRPGQHNMRAHVPFGITAYGYAPYTSYAYPGGLDLRVINGPD